MCEICNKCDKHITYIILQINRILESTSYIQNCAIFYKLHKEHKKFSSLPIYYEFGIFPLDFNTLSYAHNCINDCSMCFIAQFIDFKLWQIPQKIKQINDPEFNRTLKQALKFVKKN